MVKTILITGATDGIGLETAKALASEGHNLLIHGRSSSKLDAVHKSLGQIDNAGSVSVYLADLSNFAEVKAFVEKIKAEHQRLDVLINNAGVFKMPNPITADGLDARFVVNTIVPFYITQQLMPLFVNTEGQAPARVINLSSAAQAPVDINALKGDRLLSDMEAYAQSKLAITMWTQSLATENPKVTFIAVNPGSLLASKMVKEGFGVQGNDLSIGVNILKRVALESGMETNSGRYFDNDIGEFSSPHPDGNNIEKSNHIINTMQDMLTRFI